MSKSFRSLLGSAALILAVLFTAVGAGQYLFLSHQLRQKTTDELRGLAEGIKKDLAFKDAWNLQGYRRTTSGPDIYLILTQNGTLVDTHGYFQGMLSRVSLPFQFEYDRQFRATSEVGEVWNLYVHRLSDGLVILGARAEVTPGNIGERFVANAARFGSSVADALRTPERAIDETCDYAVIDARGTLRWAIGGIPLRTAGPVIPDHPTLAPVRSIDRSLYSVFVEPVMSRSGRKVGVISVFQDVTDERRVLYQSAIFNAGVAAILWSLTVATAAAYLRRVRRTGVTCAQVPFLEESDTIEFKSSLRWDYVKQKATKDVERAIVKAVVGFLNSESGGTLVIGISDHKEVLGLDADYATFRSVKPDLRPTGRKPAPRSDRDGFERMLHQLLINVIGERRCARWIKVRFCSLQGKEVCIVTVTPASEPVFLEEEGGGQLYVRVGNSTRPFGVQEALAYARDRWGGLAFPRPHAGRPAAHPAG